MNVKEEEVTVGRGRNKKVKSVRPLWFVKWKDFDESNNSWISRECFADNASCEEADAMYTSFLEKKKVCSKEAIQSNIERVQRLQQKVCHLSVQAQFLSRQQDLISRCVLVLVVAGGRKDRG